MKSLVLLLALVGAPNEEVKLLHTEVDAVGWAFAALMEYPEADRPFISFVYLLPYADPEWINVANYAVNMACNHSRNLHRGRLHAGGWLLSYDMRALAPDPKKQALLIQTWDSLAARSSKFHVPDINTTGSVAILAPHLQAALAVSVDKDYPDQRLDALVTQMTSSTGAIYPADFLIEQLLTSLVGKYPEFRQMDGAPKAGTAFQNLLSEYGFYFESSRDLGGDKGALIFISDVTGKGRLVMTTYGLTSRQPLTVTFDIKDARIRPDEQFVRNLLEFDALTDAKESFVPRPDGLIDCVLVDGKGNLQRAAPPDIVADSTKPDGHTKQLEMAMSCIICHADQDGYRTAKNDMEFLIRSKVDFFGDATEITTFDGTKKQLTKQEAVEMVTGRYGERIDDPDGILGRARRDYIRAVDLITDYDPTSADSSVKQVGNKIKSIYHTYRYGRIDAERACLELGVKVSKDKALEVLNKLVPDLPAGSQEDVMIPLLKGGAEIRRDDFNAIYVEMARRSMETRKGL